ncbi:flagellar basal-body rod protein FlgC [Desulfohalotomaculum tongense]|uniref:flagellar basal body rod protein FlgC n=1 Tax=Desulforadius tongensis TaxID=1216062 RepID=UPI00195B40D2|nr:flagellar basal body rod protein FlgC [Desulforadius tongensis]MBM7854207.1 flagellar basal-body rod protein FlgC [Desulforadius tongensis]
MGLFDSFAISASGMSAERLRLDIIANNLANIDTAGKPGDPKLAPYRRQVPLFARQLKKAVDSRNNVSLFSGAGVRVAGIVQDPAPPRMVYDPSHPYADDKGYVAYPNINVLNEMVDMITAARAYEANVTALNAAKGMALKALEIGRG